MISKFLSNTFKKATGKLFQNSILILHPYLSGGAWVFDDDKTGLVREPFVMGIPEILETALEANGIPLVEAAEGFDLYFSANPFPGQQVELTWLESEHGGNWYKAEGTEQFGWLCPALFKYFAQAPKKIFAKCERSKK